MLTIISTFKFFYYQTKLLQDTAADGVNRNLRDTTIAMPLKDLSNFWRSLEILPINCKVESKLKGNAQFIFLCNPQKSLINVFLMKI